MKRKQALKYIAEQIVAGQSKANIYKELLPKVRYKSDLLSYMAEIPDFHIMQQIKPLNVVLISALTILVILHSILAAVIFHETISINIPWLVLGGWFYFIWPLLLLFVIIDIARFRRTGYQTFFLYAILFAGQIAHDRGAYITWGYLYVFWIISIILTVLIRKKAFRKVDQNAVEAELQQQ